MSEVKIELDDDELKKLGTNIVRAKHALIEQLGERGSELLRKEIKSSAYVTGNLYQGVGAPVIDEAKMEAEITVTARSGATAGGTATVHYPSGKTKQVSLRPRPAYNYASVNAKGYSKTIKPKTAKALLIPVPSVDKDETYLTINGQIFVMRKFTKGIKANPFDDRAAATLEKEAPQITDVVFRKFFE